LPAAPEGEVATVLPIQRQEIECGIVEIPSASHQVSEALTALKVERDHLAIEDHVMAADCSRTQ
jgi:hypothetical protein